MTSMMLGKQDDVMCLAVCSVSGVFKAAVRSSSDTKYSLENFSEGKIGLRSLFFFQESCLLKKQLKYNF